MIWQMTVLGNHNNQKSTLTFFFFPSRTHFLHPVYHLRWFYGWRKMEMMEFFFFPCASLKACNFHITALYATYRQLIGSLTLPFALAHTEIYLRVLMTTRFVLLVSLTWKDLHPIQIGICLVDLFILDGWRLSFWLLLHHNHLHLLRAIYPSSLSIHLLFRIRYFSSNVIHIGPGWNRVRVWMVQSDIFSLLNCVWMFSFNMFPRNPSRKKEHKEWALSGDRSKVYWHGK